MTPTITADLIEAYSHCPRKAFLLMAGEPNPVHPEYVRMIAEQAADNRLVHRNRLAGDIATFESLTNMVAGREILSDAELTTDDLNARFDFLTKTTGPSRMGTFGYEPVKVIGTYRASKADALGLAYQALVLGEVQGRLPATGTLVLLGNRASKVKLAAKYREVQRIVEALRVWVKESAGDAPSIVLNKQCPICAFPDCLEQAERDDNLSLLDRMTPKLMRKYHEKSIFTVKQLSYT